MTEAVGQAATSSKIRRPGVARRGWAHGQGVAMARRGSAPAQGLLLQLVVATHDARRWMAAGRERRGEAEAKMLRQGRSDRRCSDIAALSACAHGGMAARRGVAWRGVLGGSNAPNRRAPMQNRGGRQVGPSGRNFSD
jgi:hypothetical protein